MSSTLPVENESLTYLMNMAIAAGVAFVLAPKLLPAYPREQVAGSVMAASVIATYMSINSSTRRRECAMDSRPGDAHVSRSNK
jgi:hypothetical protein